jgi:dethiobiotin synthetase
MSAMQQFFITATGTNQGKTLLTSALCYQWQQQHKTVAALKPVISGYTEGEDSDTSQILKSLGYENPQPEEINTISPWRFRLPLSPDEAARQENRTLSLKEITDFCLQPRHMDLCLIEGAGGVMSPLSATATNLDLIAAVNWPVILVSASYLGCISAILTAYETLRIRGIQCQHLALVQVDKAAQASELTLRSLLPHLPEEMRILQLNHLEQKQELWKYVPQLREWVGSVYE